LELRLEHIKCLSNIQFKLLQSVCDVHPIAERYRKLCSIYDIAGINLSQLIDKIIQRGTQIIDDLSGKYAEYLGGRPYWESGTTQNALDLSTIWEKEGCWLAWNDNCTTFFLPEDVTPSLEIRQVYPCPFNPLISAIK